MYLLTNGLTKHNTVFDKWFDKTKGSKLHCTGPKMCFENLSYTWIVVGEVYFVDTSYFTK